MKNIAGLLFFWLAADFVASLVSPTGGMIIGTILLVVVLSVIGGQVLSVMLREEASPAAGFMLALPGWLLTQYVFGWHLINPGAVCGSDPNSVASCGFGVAMGAMLVNFAIVAIGMAIVALPALPLIKKLRER